MGKERKVGTEKTMANPATVFGVDLEDDSADRTPVLTVILWVAFYLLTLLKIFALLVWRLIVGAVVFAFNIVQSIFNNRLLVGVILALIVAGIPLQVFPESIFTLSDEVYECGVRPAAEATTSVLNTILVVPYEFLAESWNTLILFLTDSIGGVYGNLLTLQRTGRIASVGVGARAIGEALLAGDLEDLFVLIQDIIATIGDYLAGWGMWFVDGLAYLTTLFNTWFIELSFFSGSCSFCSADPAPRDCALRSPLLPGQSEFDCNECHELSVGFGRLIGSLLDTVTGSFLDLLDTGTSFERIGGAVMCVVRSFVMYPIYTVAGLIEGCIDILDVINVADPNSFVSRWWLAGDPLIYNDCVPGADAATCCGKPAGCTFPVDGGEDYPIGITPCFGELVRALTGDAIDDLIELILEFLLPIVGDVVKTVDRIFECAGDPAYNDCLRTYPTNGVAGEPGFCEFSPPEVPPTNGVFRCFEIQFECLAANVSTEAPLLEFLVVPGGVLEFLLGDFWRFSLDAAVCGIAQMIECFEDNPVTDFDTLIDAFECVCDGNPIFGPILGCPFEVALTFLRDNIIGPIQDTIDDIIEIGITAIQAAVDAFQDIDDAFECLSRCGAAEIIAGDPVVECLNPPIEAGDGCDQLMSDSSADGYMNARRDGAQLSPPTAEEMTRWWTILHDMFAVPPNSFCGRVLSSTHPRHAASLDYGSFLSYKSCLSMYAARRNAAKSCGYTSDNMTDVTNIDTLSASSPMFATWDILTASNCTRVPKVDANPDSAASRLRTTLRGPGHRLNITLPSFITNMNATSWQFMPDIVYPLLDNIRQTPYGVRSAAFYNDYREAERLRAETDPESPRYHSLGRYLDTLYVDFSNDILARRRTGFWRNETLTLAADLPPTHGDYIRLDAQYVGADGKTYTDLTVESMEAGTKRFWNRLEELHLVDAATNKRAYGLWGLDKNPTALGNDNETLRQLALGGKRSAFALSPEGREAWDTINDATYMGWWPGFARASGIVRALRARDGRALMGMLNGRLQYRMDTDEFLSRAEFERVQPAAARAVKENEQPAPTILTVGAKALARSAGYDLPLNTWNSRFRRHYAPFPVPVYPAGDIRATPAPSWIPGALEHAQKMHDKYRAKRQARLDAGGSLMQARRQQAASDFDVNLILTRLVDSIIQIFTGSTGPGPFETLANETVEFWSEFDIRNFTFTNVTDTLQNFLRCTVPDNIDGPEPGSPFCILLFYEDALDLLAPQVGSEFGFPLQLGYPEALITEQCVSTYNGVFDLLNFKFTNNCDLPLPPDPDVRECNLVNTSCVGDVTLTMNPQVAAAQDEIEYTIAQDSLGATCPVTQATFAFPQGCANLVNVTGDCVTNFSLVDDSPSPDQNCMPQLDGPGVQGTLVVSFDDNTIGNTCTFRVKYSIGVVITANPASFILTGGDEPACANCSLRFPTVTCKPFDSEPVDLYRDSRPLCDTCDYCAREYQSCPEAGFADALDSFFYITGNLGFWLDELIFGGLDAKTFELWYALPITVISFAILFFLVIACVGIPIWVVSMNLARILPWIFFIFFGGIIPWPVVFGGLAVYIQLRKAPWWEILFWIPIIATFPGIPLGIRLFLFVLVSVNQSERAVELFRPLFVILGIVFVIWVATLVFETPTFGETLRINEALSEIFIFFDSSLFFLYLAIASSIFAGVALVAAIAFFAASRRSVAFGVIALIGALVFGALAALFWFLESQADFTGVVARISEYSYDTVDDVPDFHNFCFAISWWNIAILLSLGVFAGGIFRLAYRGVFAVALWVLDIIIWIFAIFFTARRIAFFNRIRSNTAAVDRNTDRIKRAYEALRKSTAKRTAAVFARIKASIQFKSQEEGDRLAAEAERRVELRYMKERRNGGNRSGPDSGASAAASAAVGTARNATGTGAAARPAVRHRPGTIRLTRNDDSEN